MTRKKNQKIITKKYKQKHRILKKLGFIETDGRRKLTATEKRKITSAWNRHSEITQSRKEFAIRKINKQREKLFKELGYKTHKGKVYINKEDAEKVSIRYEKINGKKETVIVKSGNFKDIKDFVVPRDRIHNVAETLSKQKLKKGEFLTAQIEGRSKFRKRFKSMEALQKYISQFQPQQPLNKKHKRGKRAQEKLRQELIDKMSIVKFNA